MRGKTGPAEEIEARPDANVFDRCGAWARVQAARVAMSLHEQGAAYAALDRAEGTVA